MKSRVSHKAGEKIPRVLGRDRDSGYLKIEGEMGGSIKVNSKMPFTVSLTKTDGVV